MKMKGIIPPMITPLRDYDKLDTSGVEKTINWMIEGGVHGIFILGTTGEAPNLSYRIRKELIKTTIAEVNNRVPVLVGVTDSSTEESISLAQYASDSGAAAVVLAPPYYSPISQKELGQWLDFIVKKIPLPMMLYNMPSHTKVKIGFEAVKEMVKHENVIGIKDSSGDMSYFHQLLHLVDRKDFSFLAGPEILLAETLMIGGDGGVPGGANLYPKLFVSLYDAYQSKNEKLLLSLMNTIRCVQSELYSLGSYGSSFLCSLKTAMASKGLCENVLMPPFFPFDANQKDQVKQALVKLEDEHLILKQ